MNAGEETEGGVTVPPLRTVNVAGSRTLVAPPAPGPAALPSAAVVDPGAGVVCTVPPDVPVEALTV
jgi:hypothetical protein